MGMNLLNFSLTIFFLLVIAFAYNAESFARTFLVIFSLPPSRRSVWTDLTKVICVFYFSISALCACDQYRTY